MVVVGLPYWGHLRSWVVNARPEVLEPAANRLMSHLLLRLGGLFTAAVLGRLLTRTLHAALTQELRALHPLASAAAAQAAALSARPSVRQWRSADRGTRVFRHALQL